MAFTRVSHSSTCFRYAGSAVRAVPAVAVSQPGKPPASVSAPMYGPGRSTTYSPHSAAVRRNRPRSRTPVKSYRPGAGEWWFQATCTLTAL